MAFAEKMAETKLAGLKAVEPKLQAFYDSLDAKQKEAFDTGGRIGGIFDWWGKMTYVIQLDGAHVLPFRLPTPAAVLHPPGAPYFAFVARTTAQLKMKPVIIMNLDTS